MAERSSRGGFTIPEVMVAMSLLGLLLAGLYAVTSLAFQHVREAEIFDAVHREAAGGLQKISQELALTSKGSVGSLGGSGQSFIIFGSPHNLTATSDFHHYAYDANGNLQWRKWVGIYRDDQTNRALRAEIALPDGEQAAPPLPADQPLLSDFQALTPAELRPLCRNCTLLEFRDGTSAFETIKVTLQVERRTATDRSTTVYLETEVHPRNKGS